METKNKLKKGLLSLALGAVILAFTPIAAANVVVGYFGDSMANRGYYYSGGYYSPSYSYSYATPVYYSGSPYYYSGYYSNYGYYNSCCGPYYYCPSVCCGYAWY